MSEAGPSLPNSAAAMRQAFDRSFAEPPSATALLYDDFLAIRLGPDPHAVPLAEIARLLPLQAVTRVPSAIRALLGVAGIAGSVVPVYDLRLLLGYATTDPPRWMVVAAMMPVALAFDGFEGQFRRPRDMTADRVGLETSRQHGARRATGTSRPVLPVASILATIESLARSGASQQED